MKKILLVLLMCTSGAHAAVVVTHAYGYGVHPVVIAPRPVVVAPAPVVVTAAPVVTSAPVAHPVAAAVGAVGVGVYRHNERQDAYDEINHLQDQRINAYNQHHH
ncbi:Uncharacterised protein [Serratia liquefaciens]|uniref:hypothetical protein n=1 Tax=Serratia liquefaciens TaxID=614 RepID=UPI002179F203|nr:hypothetical protein [Serratia liquefaciens]CAI0866185.1 Uncharacterised protein [Serratia liquefaciens]CAI1804736.1 Uncharacterised protein [Serratia liquefaciens]